MKAHQYTKGMVALAALVLVGGTACEQGEGDIGVEQEALDVEVMADRHGQGMKRGMGFGPRIMAELDLTEAQQAAISNLRAQAQAERASKRDQMQGMRTELQELWQAEQPDADAILAKQSEMDALRDGGRNSRHALKQAIQEVLTPEQREQIAEHRSSRQGEGRRGRRGGGRGQGGPGGPGQMDGMGPHGGGPGMRGGHGRGGGMGRFQGRALQQLDLMAEQQAQIDALQEQAQEATSEARAELQAVRQAMRAARTSGEVDSDAIEALHARGDAARQVVREQAVHTRIAVLGILTAEQRAELQELRAERGERRGRGHGRGFGPGQGAGMDDDGIGRGRGGRGHGKGFGRRLGAGHGGPGGGMVE